mmetsp:Transcript_6335/g.12879  ORF Transcript_6335/g.12879 Transcript_6335/m.12879 type:complete len:164 (-) Transcript_6335:205-696(-)
MAIGATGTVVNYAINQPARLEDERPKHALTHAACKKLGCTGTAFASTGSRRNRATQLHSPKESATTFCQSYACNVYQPSRMRAAHPSPQVLRKNAPINMQAKPRPDQTRPDQLQSPQSHVSFLLQINPKPSQTNPLTPSPLSTTHRVDRSWLLYLCTFLSSCS